MIFWELVKALPEIIALLKAIQKGIDEVKTERKISDDVKALHEAFSAKDADRIRAIFNGTDGVRIEPKTNTV